MLVLIMASDPTVFKIMVYGIAVRVSLCYNVKKLEKTEKLKREMLITDSTIRMHITKQILG